MAIVQDGIIYLRKGDTETLTVSATSGGSAYTFQNGDIVTFTVRELPDSSSAVLMTASTTVTTPATSVDVVLSPTVTGAVAAGRYSCDVQLNSDGMIKTLFPVTDPETPLYKDLNWRNCIVEGEVTFNG